MAAGSKPKYYLVEASVLPEIFAKVIEAKELLDRQGVLSSVLAIFAENGANILTIIQSIPTSGVAPVTITAATENMQTTMEAFMAALKAAEGIIRVHLMAG